MSVLDDILDAKRDEVARLTRPSRREALCREVLDAPPPRDFAGALRRHDGRLAVIAEIKRRSPSKGDLAPGLDPAASASAYEAGGAAALSVLTDGPFFGGSVDDLRVARAATALPVLRKDFTIDEAQVIEARAVGADAVLLIAAAVPDDALLCDLRDAAGDLELTTIFEVHEEHEVDRVLGAGARVVGVNARDLATFDEDVQMAERLAVGLPADVVAVAESAIRTPADARRMADAGFDAVLVGEALVRDDDPASAVRAMAAASVHRR